MNTDKHLAAWYDSVEREDVTDDLTVTHVHTTGGTVTLDRDWLAVDETGAEWGVVIKLLFEIAGEASDLPLRIPVDTAVEELTNVGLVHGTNSEEARFRAQALLALLHAENAIELDGDAVVVRIEPKMSGTAATYRMANFLEFQSECIHDLVDEYGDKLEELEEQIEDLTADELQTERNHDHDKIAIRYKKIFDNCLRIFEVRIKELRQQAKKWDRIADDVRASAADSTSNRTFWELVEDSSSVNLEELMQQQAEIVDWYDDFEKTAESEILSSEYLFRPEYSKEIQSEAEIPEPEEVEEFGLSSAPSANPDTDETED